MNVLVVGSSVIDLFLTIDNHAEINGKKVSFNLGDKIPTNIKHLGLGGNGANVSVGLTRLEIPSTFYTYLGGDILSKEIEEGLSREGIELMVERGKDYSSSLSIIFDFNDDRIIFSHHEKRENSFSLSKKEFDFIYLTSIGELWEKAYANLFAYAAENKIPLAFSPGTHQLENINDTVFNIIKNSKIFFSNKEEAEIILGRQAGGANPKELLLGIKEMGPAVVSITDGENGSYACDENNNIYSTKALRVEKAEKTGAGDAYAGGFFAAYLEGIGVEEGMKWGALNAQSVMRQIGAQNGLLSKKEIESLVKTSDLHVENL